MKVNGLRARPSGEVFQGAFVFLRALVAAIQHVTLERSTFERSEKGMALGNRNFEIRNSKFEWNAMPKPSIIHLRHHRQEQGTSCLAACVVMVLAHWQVAVSEGEIRRLLKTKPYAGTHPVSLLRLRELGFEAWP